jgi:hypothetical protein
MRTNEEAIIMARFNSKHEGDKAGTTKVTVVPGIIYDLTQLIGADCSGIRPAMRQQKGELALEYLDLLHKAVDELDGEIHAAIASWSA